MIEPSQKPQTNTPLDCESAVRELANPNPTPHAVLTARAFLMNELPLQCTSRMRQPPTAGPPHGPMRCQVSEGPSPQGYLAHKKDPPPPGFTIGP